LIFIWLKNEQIAHLLRNSNFHANNLILQEIQRDALAWRQESGVIAWQL
jgi:hypothetical protein